MKYLEPSNNNSSKDIQLDSTSNFMYNLKMASAVLAGTILISYVVSKVEQVW